LRRYSNRLGRFYSVDPVAPDIYTPATQNRFQYCLNNPLRFIDSGGGYDEEVHRDLTAALAYVAGFSEAQGNAIGKADQWLDDPTSGLNAFEWNSDLGYSNRVNYHFTTEKRRNELWGAINTDTASEDDLISAIGTYLHAQQDSFSHEGFIPILGQWPGGLDNFNILTSNAGSMYQEGAKYDQTTFDPEKAVRMARDTLGKLIQIRNQLAAKSRFGPYRKPVPVDDKFINDKLLQWAKTEGRDEKRKILIEIMRYATYYGQQPPQTTKPEGRELRHR